MAPDDFKLIQLVTPTTPRERARASPDSRPAFSTASASPASPASATDCPPKLLDQLRWLRTQTDLPLCVGFGVSRPEHVELLREVADGVIVGSALVRHLGRIGHESEDAVIREIGEQVALLVDALQ